MDRDVNEARNMLACLFALVEREDRPDALKRVAGAPHVQDDGDNPFGLGFFLDPELDAYDSDEA